MESEAQREKSFLAIKWPHANTGLTPERLAAAGFYAAPTPKVPDRVLCFSCQNALTNWDPTDDPWTEHKTWYPQCPFVQGRATGNVPKGKEVRVKEPKLDLPTGPSNRVARPKGFDNGAELVSPRAPQPLNTETSGSGIGTGMDVISAAKAGLGGYIQALTTATTSKDDTKVIIPEINTDIVFRGTSKGQKPENQTKPNIWDADAVSPASQVLAMWEEQVSSERHTGLVTGHASLPNPKTAPEPDFEMPSVNGGDWAAPVVSTSVESLSKTKGAKKKKDLPKKETRQRDEFVYEIEEQQRKREDWAKEEEEARQRISSLELEEKRKVSETAAQWKKLHDLIGGTASEIEKKQSRIVEGLETKLSNLDEKMLRTKKSLNSLSPQWFSNKASLAKQIRQEVAKLRDEESGLRSSVESLGAQALQHSEDLKKVAELETVVARNKRQAEEFRAERQMLDSSLAPLKEQASRLEAERRARESELLDVQDTLDRRKLELEGYEAKLKIWAERESTLQADEMDLKAREAALAEREARVKAREEWVARKDGQVKAVESVLLARERKIQEIEEQHAGIQPQPTEMEDAAKWGGQSPRKSPYQMRSSAPQPTNAEAKKPKGLGAAAKTAKQTFKQAKEFIKNPW